MYWWWMPIFGDTALYYSLDVAYEYFAWFL